MPQLPPPLPTNRAFGVSFRAQPPGHRWPDGRVEHIQVARFHALEERLAFRRRVLTEVAGPPGAE